MIDPLDFTGKRVLVIGGSSGIGNGIAQGFGARGADVHVTGTRPDEGDYLEAEDSDFRGLTYHQLDVSERDRVDSLAEKIGAFDVLILCQGIVRYNREEFEAEGWDKVVQVNLTSLMDCARAFRAGLAERGGSITIVSSTGGFHGMIGNPAYGASKAGAVSLVKSLAQAWAKDGLRVNGIAPGFVPTKMTRVTTENENRREGAIARIPLGRMGRPEDMAGAALFLASPLASYITGQSLIVDGGLSL
ncbi:SDR family NAD(P)-dependent oxidoreductase [Altererythrobacter lutimaris]|uniref:SDR family oxidoreductase n=1 Tax=Altererythrobacter lutimaris TaxID=2743979 RepID=A0A850HA89_9SPHN|nr:SDR family oxidoreductase [Altererythrobacter lutimaris]NVE93368.1 SDR family oxidoreductase [Altererythrobacter lutimaris]